MPSLLRKIASIVVVAFGITALVGPAAAQQPEAAKRAEAAPKKQPTVEEQLRHAYDEAVAEERVTLEAYQISLDRMAELEGEIIELDAAIEVVSGYLAAGQVKVEQAQDRLADGEARLQATEVELAAERSNLQKKAVTAYISGNEAQMRLLAVLGAKEVNDLEPTRAYTDAVIDDQLGAVARVKKLEAEMTVLRDRLVSDEAAVRKVRDAVAAYDAELAQNRVDVEALRIEQQAETARQQDLLTEIRSRKQSYLDRIRALERESDGFARILQQVQFEQILVVDGPLIRTPLEPPVGVASNFGMRLHPIFQEPRMHTGADLNATQGTPIRAAASGVVVIAETEEGYGNVVVIDHGSQLATVSAHMSRVDVKAGDRVERGQVIGLVGSTGYSTGPHLHFEVRVQGKPVDPLPFIDFDEPLPGSCEALRQSELAEDKAELAGREDCRIDPTAATSTTVE